MAELLVAESLITELLMVNSMTGNLLPVTFSKRRLATCPTRVKTKLPTYDHRLGLVTGVSSRYISLSIIFGVAMSERPTCSELELDNQLCFALYSTSLMMTKVYKPLLKELGLTYPQYLAMLVLWQEDGITVGTMSKRLLTDPGSLTPLLKRLEADQLLNRKRSYQDERVVELYLTEKGRNLREHAHRIPSCVVNASEQSIEALTTLKEDLVRLRDSLQKNQ